MNNDPPIIQEIFTGIDNIDSIINLPNVNDPYLFESLFQEYDLPSDLISRPILGIPENTFEQSYELNCRLLFINAPNEFYHVRYSSEITDKSKSGTMIEEKRMKKNISGRYLKGEHGRYVIISLPSSLYDHQNLYIRVTRLTVSFNNISFIHPYPLLYIKRTKSNKSTVLFDGSSIYYKITKEELCSGLKHFPNIVLTRLKQCELKERNVLKPFDTPDASYPISGTSKEKINNFQLKKSQLDFRVALFSEETRTFQSTNIFCRSNELTEIEGFAWKKSSR